MPCYSELKVAKKNSTDTLLLHALDFLTNPTFEKDRESAVTGLFYALVEKAHGASNFDKWLPPEIKSKIVAAMLNINLVSPKASRTLRVVLDEVTPL